MKERRRRERQTPSIEHEPAYNVVPETRMPEPRAPATTPVKKSKKKSKEDPEAKAKEDQMHAAQELEHAKMEQERREQEEREKAI